MNGGAEKLRHRFLRSHPSQMCCLQQCKKCWVQATSNHEQCRNDLFGCPRNSKSPTLRAWVRTADTHRARGSRLPNNSLKLEFWSMSRCPKGDQLFECRIVRSSYTSSRAWRHRLLAGTSSPIHRHFRQQFRECRPRSQLPSPGPRVSNS